MEYKLVKDNTVWGLEMTVNSLITEGWETDGPLVVDKDGYVQKMIKKPVEQEVITE